MLVLTLFSLLRKPRSFCLKSLEMWFRNYFLNGCCVSVPLRCLYTPAPWHPQSNSAGCSVFLIELWTWPGIADPNDLSYRLAICMCVCLTLTAAFLMLSQFWLCTRGFPDSVTSQGEFPIYSAYCECSDLCAVVYQITLPLSRWVFISVSYPL